MLGEGEYDKARIRHLISVASRLQSLFRKRDVRSLRKFYNEMVNNIVIEFDPFEFRLTVIARMLSKFLSKPRLSRRPGISRFARKIDRALSDFVFFSKKNNISRMFGSLDKIAQEIDKLDSRDKRYVSTLLENTRVKVAATMYAKGISLSVASENTGVPPHKILDYIGMTVMADRLKAGVDVRKRLSWLKTMLG